MVINDNCISCQACEGECDNNAIYEAGAPYMINGVEKPPISEDHTFIAPELCNDCKSCAEVCTQDAIVEA